MSVERAKIEADRIAADWVSDDNYYEGAEEWTEKFWDPNLPSGSFFRPLFDRVDPSRVIDLACGRGRHTWQMRDWRNHKTLVDVVKENIDFCRKRFKGVHNVEFLQNNGVDLQPLASGSYTAIFSYDAMVHFDHLVVFSYLQESERVLKSGGMALFHHSNYGGNPGGDYKNNPNWRNFMPPGLFFDYARKANLVIVEHHVVPWGNFLDTDAVTLLRKP